MKHRLISRCTALVLACGAQIGLADDDKGLPADQVVSAIQVVASVHEGMIKDVEIEEKDKQRLVEVTVVGSDGKETEVYVDPKSSKIVSK